MTDCRLKMSKKWQYPAPWSMNQVRNLHNASRHFACTRVNGTHSSSFLSCFVHFHKAHVTDQMWFKVFGITIGQYETWKEEQGKLIRVYTHDWFHVIPFDQSAFSRPGNLAAFCQFARIITKPLVIAELRFESLNKKVGELSGIEHIKDSSLVILLKGRLESRLGYVTFLHIDIYV